MAPAHYHFPDRVGDFFIRTQDQVFFFGGQQALVEHAHTTTGPFDSLDHDIDLNSEESYSTCVPRGNAPEKAFAQVFDFAPGS